MRNAGLLLHPTSLPGSAPCGTLDNVDPLIDFLTAAGLSIWQLLPLNPVSSDRSPYSSPCSFAGNEALLAADWESQLEQVGESELEPFRTENRYWLRDYTLFTVLHRLYQEHSWIDWPEPYRDRNPDALQQIEQQYHLAILRIERQQFLFERQWQAVHQRCREAGITIMGDLPFLCAHDSVDVWAHRELFELDPTGRPTSVAGVPPDYFSESGQLWGNPVYSWPQHQMDGFRWWIERFKAVLRRVDSVRFDHFRGLSAYWSVPAAAEDARGGQWITSPGDALLTTLHNELGGHLPVIAEDLGLITEDVQELRDRHQLPGMSVLQFGFDDDPENPHLPQNHPVDTIAYSGTHDNDTLSGWYQSLDKEMQQQVTEQLKLHKRPPPRHWQMIDKLLASSAKTVILPLQDLLGLGSNHRMNVPGVAEGNWGWRAETGNLSKPLANTIRELLEHHQRIDRH